MFYLLDNRAPASWPDARPNQDLAMTQAFARRLPIPPVAPASRFRGGRGRASAEALVSLMLIAALVPSLLLGTLVLRGVVGLRQALGVR